MGPKLFAEFLGTFWLVLGGCGSAVLAAGYPTLGIGFVGVSLAFGLTVLTGAYAFGPISGGHFNPAVSVGAALGGRVAWREAGLFIAAQFVGAIIAALVLMILALGLDGFEAFDSSFPLGTNGYSEGPYDYAVWAALLVELIMTFLFVLVILGVTDARNAENVVMAPLAIGVTLAVIHFMLIPLTGTSVNPARSFGPALFSGGDWIIQVWPFLIAPFLGGAAAGFLYPLAFGHGADPVPGSGLSLGARGTAAAGFGAPTQFEQQWNQQQADYAQQAGYAQQATPAPQQEQPIIQDGWQWDPNSQQWIPAQQQPQAPGQSGGQGWAPPAGDQTQVRPPQQ